jgi:hypothetical protein
VAAALVVVLDVARTLLRLGDRDIEVVVEPAVFGGGPGEAPAHALPIGQQLRQRRARHRPQHHVVVGQVFDEAVEAVRDHRARRAAGGIVGAEHEVVDQQLQAALEQFLQRGVAGLGVEAVGLVDAYPRQRLALPCQCVAAPGQCLLGVQQGQPRGQPFLAGSGLVAGHGSAPFAVQAATGAWRR